MCIEYYYTYPCDYLGCELSAELQPDDEDRFVIPEEDVCMGYIRQGWCSNYQCVPFTPAPRHGYYCDWHERGYIWDPVRELWVSPDGETDTMKRWRAAGEQKGESSKEPPKKKRGDAIRKMVHRRRKDDDDEDRDKPDRKGKGKAKA